MELNYSPHSAQADIHLGRLQHRFRTVCCGRRFGKTMCMAADVIDAGGSGAAGDYGWVAPTYQVSERGVDAMREVSGGVVSFVGKNPVRGEFDGANGRCRVWFLSADNPDSILGFGFQGLVVDEAAAIDVKVWNYTLRPTLAQTLGWAVFISTPRGRNWFYDMHTRGTSGVPGYGSYTFASNRSPFFPEAEWIEAKRDLPEDVFRQEYEAEFLEDSAGVFRKVEDCLYVGAASPGGPGVSVGLDLAKHTDWTVLIAMDDATGQCLDMERFNVLDWPVQVERIMRFVKKWNGRITMDATGVGDPIYDDLRRLWPLVDGVKLTSGSKRELIQALMVAVEHRDISWPATWVVLTDEMKRYEYDYGASGNLSYSAPGGYHDDCVIALALANRGRRAVKKFPGNFRRLDGGERTLIESGYCVPRPTGRSRVLSGC